MNDPVTSESLQNDLIATVSHELRGPLTSIQATVKLVAEGFVGKIDPSQKQMLSLALSNIDRMGRIVNQLLDVSKIEAGRLELHPQRVEWVVLLREIALSFEAFAAERGLALQLDLPEDRIESFVDRDKIIQVFTNLLHNAIKFTPLGRITLGVREENDQVTAWVADTGPGFQPKDLPLVFGKFKRFTAASRPEDKGTGLGLALCKRLVELHGGTIRVDSAPGEGARFTLTLPHMTPEDIFRQEALRLLKRAEETAKALSLAEVRIQNWDHLKLAQGTDAAAILLNYCESQLRASLRDDSDFVIQRPGALWLAVFSATKSEAQAVIQRLERKVQEDTLVNSSATPLVLQLNVVSYPQDSADPEELLNLLSGRVPA